MSVTGGMMINLQKYLGFSDAYHMEILSPHGYSRYTFEKVNCLSAPSLLNNP